MTKTEKAKDQLYFSFYVPPLKNLVYKNADGFFVELFNPDQKLMHVEIKLVAGTEPKTQESVSKDNE